MSYALAKRLRTSIENKIHEREPRAVLDASRFPWCQHLEQKHPQIRAEAERLLQKLDSITNFDDILPGQRALVQGANWKTFFLKGLREDIEAHQALCPDTTKALQEIPGLINAFFSILRPGTHIPPHRGPYAGMLRYHLGVIVPQGDLGITVDGSTYRWEEGQSLFFDDSFEHEAWNRTQKLRVILFVDFERPLRGTLAFWNKCLLRLFHSSSTAKRAKQTVYQNLFVEGD